MIHAIDTLDDPRLSPYRELKERELARQGDRFIAESEHVVRRLLASDFATESVLLARRRADEIAPIVAPSIPVYVVPDDLMKHVLGFKFHSGVIACGIRKPSPTIEEILRCPVRGLAAAPTPHFDATQERRVDATAKQSAIGNRQSEILLVCPDLNNTENLGSIIRIAAAFGAAALVLGPRSCDPFFRQSIRVSMGTVFHLPIVRSADLIADLKILKAHNVQLIATVCTPGAEPLASATRPPRIAILLGSESHGLDAETLSLCDRQVTIPMHLGTDSLNVSIAAAVFLYHFTR